MNIHDKRHPIYLIAFVAVVMGSGLGYCHMAYANGCDPLKDGVLVGGITALFAAYHKIVST